MDTKDAFSRDPVNSISGIGREWYLSRHHDPPYVRRYGNRHRENGRYPPPGPRNAPPAGEKEQAQPQAGDGKEGFEVTI